jgi:hypothetical protein
MAGRRGKTKGATSFVTISLGTLNQVLREGATVMVSRRWAETLGLEGDKLEGSLKEIQTHGNQIGFEKQQLEDKNDAIEIKKSIDF